MKKSELRKIIREMIAKEVNSKAKVDEGPVIQTDKKCACDCGPDIQQSCFGNIMYMTGGMGQNIMRCNCGCCGELAPTSNPFKRLK